MNGWVVLGLALAALGVLYLVFVRSPGRRDGEGTAFAQSRPAGPSPGTAGQAGIRQVSPETIIAGLDPLKRAEIQNAIDNRRKIDAIIMLREAATIDLKDAKTVAEYLERKSPGM